jgi:hypothetical protein
VVLEDARKADCCTMTTIGQSRDGGKCHTATGHALSKHSSLIRDGRQTYLPSTIEMIYKCFLILLAFV